MAGGEHGSIRTSLEGYPRAALERAMKAQEVAWRALAGKIIWRQAAEIGYQWVSSLKAWVHWLLRKPGMHHNMHRGSMARAASALPISAVSHPN